MAAGLAPTGIFRKEAPCVPEEANKEEDNKQQILKTRICSHRQDGSAAFSKVCPWRSIGILTIQNF